MNKRIEKNPTTDIANPDVQGSTILIVDDAASNLQVVTAYLEDKGYRVIIARDGEQALKLAASVHPDLILLDVVMPGMNGFETCRHLKSNESTFDIPVIFMTALTATNDKITGFGTGGVDYVTKPFQIDEVLARIHTHLTLRKMQQQVGAKNAQLQKEVLVRRQAEEALRISEVRYRRLFETAKDGILLLDYEDGLITDVNPALLTMFGYTYNEFLGRALWDVEPFKDTLAFRAAVRELQEKGATDQDHLPLNTKSGERIDVEFLGSVYEVEGVKVIQCNIRDITKRAEAEERILFMATHDALTGLPNRVLMQDRILQAITHARRHRRHVALLFVDLDHFKYVNDSLGHRMGDLLLQEAATRLGGCLRESDSIARLGGDEFIIMLPDLAQNQDAIVAAKKVLECLVEPFSVNGQPLHVNGSVGISIFPADGDDPEALICAADTAMYHAKEKGRGNFQFFTPALNAAVQQRVMLVNRLHQAFAADEFILHYQSQVDIQSGELLATEALLRWQPQDASLVLPTDFVHIAEETGLIVPLGTWVLKEACRQLKRWRDSGHPSLRMAVNLSVRQFDQHDFHEMLANILSEVNLPACALDLEITESHLMRQTPQNLAILEELANMGAQIIIDDFGMGYSALSYFQRFPIHALKIDRSFVHRIGRQSNDAIVTTIITMAQNLGLKIIAEGVGTAEQAAFLLDHGCRIAQGFYYSRPVSAETFTEFLRTRPDALAVG